MLFWRLVAAENRKIKGCPDKNSQKNLVRNLDHNVGNEESLPTVRTRWPFTNLKEASLCNEAGYDLATKVRIG